MSPTFKLITLIEELKWSTRITWHEVNTIFRAILFVIHNVYGPKYYLWFTMFYAESPEVKATLKTVIFWITIY